MINNDCAKNVVEWGDNSEFKNSTGYCLCYEELCTPDLYKNDNDEHLIRLNKLNTVSSVISNKNFEKWIKNNQNHTLYFEKRKNQVFSHY